MGWFLFWRGPPSHGRRARTLARTGHAVYRLSLTLSGPDTTFRYRPGIAVSLHQLLLFNQSPSISTLNDRSREIFCMVVDAYVYTGEPVGSLTIAKRIASSLPPATRTNVIVDLLVLGLNLHTPHLACTVTHHAHM